MMKGEAQIHMQVGCIFTAYKTNKFGETEQIGPFHNLVTDFGLDSLATNLLRDMTTTLHVGTGTSTPTNSDTALETEVASTTNTVLDSKVQEASQGYWGQSRKFQFTEGQATGDLTELGLSAGGSLFNRQFFQDMDGNPITVTVASDEVFEVLCEIRVVHPVPSDDPMQGGQVTIDGTTYDYDFRFTDDSYCFWPSNAGDYSFVDLDEKGFTIKESSEPYGSIYWSDITGSNVSQSTQQSYVLGSFEIIWDIDILSSDFTGYLCIIAATFGSQSAASFWFGFSPGANEGVDNVWAASTSYSLDDVLIPSVGFDYAFKVITAGTSAGTAPTWPTTVGATVTDANGVEYECIAPLLYLASDEGITLTVKLSWGR